MNSIIRPASFPSIVLTPRSAHSLPRSLYLETIREVRNHGFNAFGFLIEDDLAKDPEADGLVNDHDYALADLKDQLPDHVREAIWPTPRAVEYIDSLPAASASGGYEEEDDDDDSGMGSGLSISMGAPGAESEFTQRRQREEQEEEQRRSPSLGM